jgi:hypothetical protein
MLPHAESDGKHAPIREQVARVSSVESVRRRPSDKVPGNFDRSRSLPGRWGRGFRGAPCRAEVQTEDPAGQLRNSDGVLWTSAEKRGNLSAPG